MQLQQSSGVWENQIAVSSPACSAEHKADLSKSFAPYPKRKCEIRPLPRATISHCLSRACSRVTSGGLAELSVAAEDKNIYC